MQKFFLPLLVLLFIPVEAKADLKKTIENTTEYLIRNWIADEKLSNKYPPPQVLSVPEGTTVYGGCGEYIVGDDVGGSSYCPPTHTIFLVPEELKLFDKTFGPSSVAYVIAHEFSHALQQALEIDLENPNHELQADCIAGALIADGSEKLNITRENVLLMADAAYAIGSDTHGTGAQRAYSLLSGMGVVDSSCEAKQIQKIVDNDVNDPLFENLRSERSASSSTDLSKTPYPKTISQSLGI